ncbi:hypothetical protein SAMN05720606_10620 [Paenibacillus polysaccharolyticus]|uniref:AAA domain-containing protein n=1 Tax=Paenibacillus polysaccharolyticus TaxID=582692 RepID=A0A1G5GSD0_9BACL|nr:hypothetical protein [Paenibacillus polysaccharolyticus]SCY54456.1 hypothetical protein SAMN05720606_10620 [Paenibacillus polysaccharolyticus]
MNIQISTLTVRCRKGVYSNYFSEKITYFYGKMGAGKSTILHLIDFCLGNELIETPALQQEFLGADLTLYINGKQVGVSRDKGSNQVNVSWIVNADEAFSVVAPTKPANDSSTLIPGTKVQSLSDLIFFLADLEPPKVRKSKLKEDTELIRLSFRDLMWYCYLDQDEIDSSFFYLGRDEHDFKRLKSRDVMRLILGFHQEQVALLESKLYETRQRRHTLLETAIQIERFLSENNIANTLEIELELVAISEEIHNKKTEVKNLKETYTSDNGHILDKYKLQARDYMRSIDEFTNIIKDLQYQVNRRQKLQNEYNVASVKVSRSNISRQLLNGINFCSCPQCGQDLEERVGLENACPLCLQSVNENANIDEVEILKADLRVRQSELNESLQRLERQLTAVEREKGVLTESKFKLDQRILELEKEYDSAFLAKARELERNIGEYEGRKSELKNLLPLPRKVEQVRLEVQILESEETKLKIQLLEARRNAEMDASNLEELKKLFVENLSIVGFPGIAPNDFIEINTTDFIPRLTRYGNNELFTTEFANLGSGGKKTIFKCCYVLAIHRLAARKGIEIPSFLMIDTPMKNISERENIDIFAGFYNLIYKLYSGELSGKQLIIVDKEFYSPINTEYSSQFDDEKSLFVKHMTPDDPLNPPLIQYYRGH